MLPSDLSPMHESITVPFAAILERKKSMAHHTFCVLRFLLTLNENMYHKMLCCMSRSGAAHAPLAAILDGQLMCYNMIGWHSGKSMTC